MAFTEVNSLDCDTTISLGGVNKKTNKKNPTQVEGYYLGTRTVPDNKKKSGNSYLHVLQTEEGKIGVWGKTNLDKKMGSVTLGAMIRITQNGMQATKNGDMYLYKVEQDKENTIDVEAAQEATPQAAEEGGYEDDGENEEDLEGEEAPQDEVRPARTVRATAQAPSAASQSRVQALLNKGRAKTA